MSIAATLELRNFLMKSAVRVDLSTKEKKWTHRIGTFIKQIKRGIVTSRH